MIKLVFCLRRLPHLSREEFHRYWLDTHGPLVRELAPALGVKRYTQVHTVTSAFSEAMSRHRGAPEDLTASLSSGGRPWKTSPARARRPRAERPAAGFSRMKSVSSI